MSSARLRLARLEASLARLPRRRCLRCGTWPDEYCVVEWPERPARTWEPPRSPSAITDFWPEERRRPDCGREPRKVTTINVTYVDGDAWRRRAIAPPSNGPTPNPRRSEP